MKRSLMWSVLAILAIVSLGFFAFATHPPGTGFAPPLATHLTILSATAGVIFMAATSAFMLFALLEHPVTGARMRRTVAALLMYSISLMARLASYVSATRRAISSESHYRNSRTYAVSR